MKFKDSIAQYLNDLPNRWSANFLALLGGVNFIIALIGAFITVLYEIFLSSEASNFIEFIKEFLFGILPKSAFCTIGDDNENIEDVSLGRLKREIEILYRSNCENVVKVFSNKLNYVEYNGHNLYYYTEEFINGTDINKLLQDKYPFSVEEIFNFAHCINNAISCLWANKVIHRDIKPQNVIYDKINGRFVLIDPGIAFELDDISYTQTGQFIGTPIYTSPEQLHSKKRDLDFRSDHFLLGICLYSIPPMEC